MNFWNDIKDLFLEIDLVNVVLVIAKIVVFYVVLMVLKALLISSLKRYLNFKSKKQKNRKNVRNYSKERIDTITNIVSSLIKYTIYPILFIGILYFVGVNPTAILSGAGLIGIVVGLGFQDLIKDLIAGFFIVFENQYEIGDLIVINGKYRGTVSQIGIKTTVLRAYTGEYIILNNRDVKDVTNFTNAKYSIVVTDFTIDYHEDVDSLYDKLEEFLKTLPEKHKDIIEIPNLKGINEVKDFGYKIEVHTKVKPLSQYGLNRALYKDILGFVFESGFKIAYPTYIVKEEE